MRTTRQRPVAQPQAKDCEQPPDTERQRTDSPSASRKNPAPGAWVLVQWQGCRTSGPCTCEMMHMSCKSLSSWSFPTAAAGDAPDRLAEEGRARAAWGGRPSSVRDERAVQRGESKGCVVNQPSWWQPRPRGGQQCRREQWASSAFALSSVK